MNQFYATIYPEDVSKFLFDNTMPFLFLREIENHLTFTINGVTGDENSLDDSFGLKIKKFFSNEVWNVIGSNYDKKDLQEILNKCADMRNKYFHYRKNQIDIDLLSNVLSILKRELNPLFKKKEIIMSSKNNTIVHHIAFFILHFLILQILI